MLGWALVFFILALAAGFFGFFGLAGVAAGIAKILFLVFLVLLVVSFIIRAIRGQWFRANSVASIATASYASDEARPSGGDDRTSPPDRLTAGRDRAVGGGLAAAEGGLIVTGSPGPSAWRRPGRASPRKAPGDRQGDDGQGDRDDQHARDVPCSRSPERASVTVRCGAIVNLEFSQWLKVSRCVRA